VSEEKKKEGDRGVKEKGKKDRGAVLGTQLVQRGTVRGSTEKIFSEFSLNEIQQKAPEGNGERIRGEAKDSMIKKRGRGQEKYQP